MGLFSRKKSLLDTGFLEGATDCHSHILFDVDDGVRTIDESLQALVFYQSHGLKHLWLTPHVMEDIPNSTDNLKERFGQLYDAYIPEGESAGERVHLHLAAEYMLDNLFEERLEAGDILAMDDNAVLVETSVFQPPYDMYGILSRIMSAGFRPLLAHVERYKYMTPDDYDKLHNMGVWMQMNIGSPLGYYGPGSQHRAGVILKKGYYKCCGSDCHRFSHLFRQFSDPVLKKKAIDEIYPLMR